MRYLVFILLTTIGAWAGLQDGRLTIISVTGEGKVLPAGTLVKENVVFAPESSLNTGEKSGATVYLSNGTKIILNAEALVHFRVLKQMEGQQIQPDKEGTPTKELGPSVTEIEVEKGKVVGDVKKLDKQSSFTLKTPVGTVRIKGTVFAVEYLVNKDGIATFNVGCARGLVQVETASGQALAIKPGQQLSMSAPDPKMTQAAGPNGERPPPPPSPQMKVEPLKADTFANIPNFTPPPPPPPPPGAAPAVKAEALDAIMQKVEQNIIKGQLDPSPTGG